MKWCWLLLLMIVEHASAAGTATLENRVRSIQMLFGEAYQLWGETPSAPPKLVFLPEEILNHKACGHSRCPVVIVAAYLDQVIYLRQDWDPSDVTSASYLVHETIHYLQDQAGMMSQVDCNKRKELEWQAYDLQNRWLIGKGGYMSRMLMIRQTLASANCE